MTDCLNISKCINFNKVSISVLMFFKLLNFILDKGNIYNFIFFIDDYSNVILTTFLLF